MQLPSCIQLPQHGPVSSACRQRLNSITKLLQLYLFLILTAALQNNSVCVVAILFAGSGSITFGAAAKVDLLSFLSLYCGGTLSRWFRFIILEGDQALKVAILEQVGLGVACSLVE